MSELLLPAISLCPAFGIPPHGHRTLPLTEALVRLVDLAGRLRVSSPLQLATPDTLPRFAPSGCSLTVCRYCC